MIARHPLCALALLALLVGAPPAVAEEPSPARILELVEALASPSWRTRSDATATLLELGPPAHRILAEACESTDLELRERARYIRARTRYDVPPVLTLRFPALLEDLSAEDPDRYAGAVEALARYGTLEASTLALQVLADPIALPLLCPERRDPARLLTIARCLGQPSAVVFARVMLGDDATLADRAVLAFREVLDPLDPTACEHLTDYLRQGGARAESLVAGLRSRLHAPGTEAPLFAQALLPHVDSLFDAAADTENPARAQCLELAALAAPERAADLAASMLPAVTASAPEGHAQLRGAIVRAMLAAGRLEQALAVPCPHTLGRSLATSPRAEAANLRATLGEDSAMVDEEVTLVGSPPPTLLAQLAGSGRRTTYRLGRAPLGAALLALAEGSGTLPVLDAHGRFAFRLVTEPGDVVLPGTGWHEESADAPRETVTEPTLADGLPAGLAQRIMIELARNRDLPVYAVDAETLAAIAERRPDPLRALVRHGTIELILEAKADALLAADEALAAAAASGATALVAIARSDIGDPSLRRRAFLHMAALGDRDRDLVASLRGVAAELLSDAVRTPSFHALEVAEGAAAFLVARGDPTTSEALARNLVAIGSAAWQPVNHFALEPVLAHPSDGAIAYLTQVLAESSGRDETVRRLIVQLCHRGWHHGEPRLIQAGKRRDLDQIQVDISDRERRLAEFADALAEATGLRVTIDPNPDAPLDDIGYDQHRGFRGWNLARVLEHVVAASAPAEGGAASPVDNDPWGRARSVPPRQGLGTVAGGNSILLTTADRAAILRTLPYAAQALRLEHDAGAQLLRWIVPDAVGDLLAIPRVLATLAGDDPVRKEVARTQLIACSMAETLEALSVVDNREAARVVRLLTGRRQLDRQYLNWLQEELDTR